MVLGVIKNRQEENPSAGSEGRTIMDRITESLLTEFSAEHGIATLTEAKRFEHFASFVTVKKHQSEHFDTEDIVCGDGGEHDAKGGDTGIDGIAIIVNGTLITDVESLEEYASKGNSLEVMFIFVQAERTSGFDASKIGNFGFGVVDFFRETPSLKRSAQISSAAEIATAIYGSAAKFNRGNPTCRLYYVTTGKWTDDPLLTTRLRAVESDLVATGLFSDVSYTAIGAEGLHQLYRQTKNAVSKTFSFPNRTVVPEVPGVSQAFLGFLPALDFTKLIEDDNGDIIRGLFYDNVRDWQEYNEVNAEIRETLKCPAKDMFVLMNNGITIIARTIQPTGNRFYISDYQIVNGCQTSHVLFDNKALLTERVMVPVRLIGTQDETVIHAIIKATNRQTEVKEEQFFALEEFPKHLELYFQSFQEQEKKIYYERRSCQYDRLRIEKARIITPPNLVRSFAAMFLNEPHRTTRNYKGLRAKIGSTIFGKGHKSEPYYCSAFSLYKLEALFRSKKLEAKFKPARFHILLATRMLAKGIEPPDIQANEMERYCKDLMDILWDPKSADDLITRAADVIETVAAGNFQRDNIRTEPFTKRVVDRCKAIARPPASAKKTVL